MGSRIIESMETADSKSPASDAGTGRINRYIFYVVGTGLMLAGTFIPEAFATGGIGEFKTGVEGGLKPIKELLADYRHVPTVCLAICAAFFSEGDMRQKGKNSLIGALMSGGMVEGLYTLIK